MSVGDGQLGVGTCAAFEFADACGDRAEVVGCLGEGESAGVAHGPEVVGARNGGWVDEQVPGFSGDGGSSRASARASADKDAGPPARFLGTVRGVVKLARGSGPDSAAARASRSGEVVL